MKTYEQSRIWARTLAPQGNDDKFHVARARLAQSFIRTREAIIPLVRKIEAELPSLTLHDETHLDALWHVADTLTGQDFEVNPAEAYVLGMAFLLHDAATSSFAYSNGISELRKTVEWTDYVTQQGFTEDQLRRGEPEYQQVLFETLRLLHANRAETLLTQNWQDLNGQSRYLLEDVELRNHYGKVIGRIAASHGMDASAVEQEWASASLVVSHSSLGLDATANWSVDRLKLAMLLRCIDAAHIDSLRAPDVPFMLNAPAGESKKHWTFQNKLSAVAINPKGELYWSSSAFDITQSDAWWRCYETCRMIDREIRTSNRILSDHARKTMLAVGVRGANDIEVFQKDVPVEGWHPFDFNFQVSQVGSVIEKFGGARLYGDDPTISLRELIQNAADAIRARRFQIGNQSHGKILVSLRSADDGATWLDVTDDGLGMSRYVLTEVLLDFGRSLWKDSSLRDQWRGLATKGFTPVGRYGIGFFSIFMLGDEVKVTTWRYGSSINEQVTLHLRNRVIERPILLQATEEERLTENGTRVSVKLRNGRETLLKEPPKRLYGPQPKAPRLEEIVAYLAPTLDIDVWCHDGEVPLLKAIEANDWYSLDPYVLLRRLQGNVNEESLRRYAGRVQPMIGENGEVVGRAALMSEKSFLFDGCGALVHRGLRTGKCDGIIGYVLAENSNDLARLNSLPVVSGSTLRTWAKEQVSVNRNAVPPLTEKIASLDCGDASSVIGRRDGQLVTIRELIELFKTGEISELVCFEGDVECPDDMSQSDFSDFEYLDTLLDLTQANCSSRFSFGMKDWIEEVIPSAIGNPKTITGLLEFHLRAEFRDLIVYSENRVVGTANFVDFEEECLVFERIPIIE